MIRRVLTDEALRDRLVGEAEQHVRSFDWSDVARQTAAVYAELVRDRVTWSCRHHARARDGARARPHTSRRPRRRRPVAPGQDRTRAAPMRAPVADPDRRQCAAAASARPGVSTCLGRRDQSPRRGRGRRPGSRCRSRFRSSRPSCSARRGGSGADRDRAGDRLDPHPLAELHAVAKGHRRLASDRDPHGWADRHAPLDHRRRPRRARSTPSAAASVAAARARRLRRDAGRPSPAVCRSLPAERPPSTQRSSWSRRSALRPTPCATSSDRTSRRCPRRRPAAATRSSMADGERLRSAYASREAAAVPEGSASSSRRRAVGRRGRRCRSRQRAESPEALEVRVASLDDSTSGAHTSHRAIRTQRSGHHAGVRGPLEEPRVRADEPSAACVSSRRFNGRRRLRRCRPGSSSKSSAM